MKGTVTAHGARRALAAILLLGAGLSSGTARAQRHGGHGHLSRFQHPAAERRIQAPEDASAAGRHGHRSAAAGEAESVEQQLYLRERPDTGGGATHAHESQLLDRLLHQREHLVDVRRHQAIRLLESFIHEEPESAPEMADALLRLAEMRWELARADYLHAFAAWQNVPEQNRGPKPEPDYARAMQLWDRILDRHHEFERYDLVLYMKAYAYVELDDADKALDLYRRILHEFPSSRFVPDAHFALAEGAFGQDNGYEAALHEYDAVLQYPDSELYDIALFKSAWCLWRLNRNQDAAMRFRQVLDLGQHRTHLTAAQRRRLGDLQNEALDYLIQVFTEDESNTAQDVFHFLKQIGGERYANRVLRKLSRAFYDQGRFERSIEAYKLLLHRDPSVPEAPRFQRQIAAGWAALGDDAHTVEALSVLAHGTEPDGQWARQQGDPEVVRQAREMAEKAVRHQALEWHEVGQRDSDRTKLQNAVALYRVYLHSFPDAPHAYEVEFYLAEILFHRLEKWREAGDAYLAAARMKPHGQYTRDALYNAIGAFERVREGQIEHCLPPSQGHGGGQPASNGAAPGALSGQGGAAQTAAGGAGAAASGGAAQGGTAAPGGAPDANGSGQGGSSQGAQAQGAGHPAAPQVCGETDNDRKFSQAIDLYVQLFPNDPDLPEILFRQGRLYYDRDIFDPAVRLFGQLLERYPSSQYAEPAGELILDSFNRAQDYSNIERWARRLKSAPSFQSADKQRKLDGLILQSMFKVGEQLAQQGKHAEAADAYFRAAEEFPHDDRSRKAYYNAGLERQRAGDLSGAAQAYDRLIERYPGSTEGALGAWAAAQMYESIAQFRDAAGYYEKYGDKFPHGEKAEDALYNAVLLRMTAGDSEAAVQDGQRFLDHFPHSSQADDVYFFIGRAHEAAHAWDDAARTYREYIRRSRNLDRKVEAETRLGQVLLSAGNARGADRAFTEAVRLAKHGASHLHDGLYYAAQARYLQGDQVIHAYDAIHIDGDPSGLQQRLQKKSELLQRAALIYADVVQFHVSEWVTAALFQIGRSFETFAEAMRQAPMPNGLNDQEQQAYRDQLNMFIVPMEERALDAYQGGYQKALELHIFNHWTEKLREGLTRLNDVQYPPLREEGGDIVQGAPLPLPEAMTELGSGHTGGADHGHGSAQGQHGHGGQGQGGHGSAASHAPAGGSHE